MVAEGWQRLWCHLVNSPHAQQTLLSKVGFPPFEIYTRLQKGMLPAVEKDGRHLSTHLIRKEIVSFREKSRLAPLKDLPDLHDRMRHSFLFLIFATCISWHSCISRIGGRKCEIECTEDCKLFCHTRRMSFLLSTIIPRLIFELITALPRCRQGQCTFTWQWSSNRWTIYSRMGVRCWGWQGLGFRCYCWSTRIGSSIKSISCDQDELTWAFCHAYETGIERLKRFSWSVVSIAVLTLSARILRHNFVCSWKISFYVCTCKNVDYKGFTTFPDKSVIYLKNISSTDIKNSPCGMFPENAEINIGEAIFTHTNKFSWLVDGQCPNNYILKV